MADQIRVRVIPALLILLGILVAPIRAQEVSRTLIIGDTSGSMRGYTNGGSTKFSALYQLIYRNTDGPQLVALSSDPKTQTARVDPVAQPSVFASPTRYHGETDLVFAMLQVQQHGGLNLLITDGMQSGGTYLRVKDALLNMVRDGWGLWLFSLKLPFNGIYDPEQTLDLDALEPSIRECAAQDDNEAKVTHKSGSTRLYNYSGKKPLLIFILTKDIKLGRELTQRLEFNLKADPQYFAQVAELSPLFHRGLDFSAAEAVSDYVRLEENQNEVIIHSDTADQTRVKEINIPVKWQAGEAPFTQPFHETPAFATPPIVPWMEDLLKPTPDDNDPEGKYTPGRFKVPFVSEVAWYRFLCGTRIISCEELKPETLNLEVWTEFQDVKDGWWTTLNTDNSYQCPARIYKLGELVHDLAQVAKERLKPEQRKATRSIRLIVGRV